MKPRMQGFRLNRLPGVYHYLDACRLNFTGDCGRVLGIDPGLRAVGVAVAEKSGGSWRVVYRGTLAPHDLMDSLPELVRGSCACGLDSPLQPQPPGGFRVVERASLKLGARLLPGWASMRRLAAIGVALAALLQEAGVVPVETHPYTAAAIARIPWAVGMGRHEWEAVAAAAAAAAWVEGRAVEVEGPDGCLVFPTRGIRLAIE